MSAGRRRSAERGPTTASERVRDRRDGVAVREKDLRRSELQLRATGGKEWLAMRMDLS